MKLEQIKKLKNSKAFTLIELIVVIAVLGILVLLAAPKFLGYTAESKLAQIKADIKTYETAIGAKMVDNPDIINEWASVDKTTMNGYKDENKLLDTKGVVDYELGGTYIDIPEDKIDVKTNLPGDFLMDSGGKVYYYDENFKKPAGKGHGSSENTDGEVLETNPEPAIPLNNDRDGDGISNDDELNIYKTDPDKLDTDDDGLSDYDEIFVHKTNPLEKDTDKDGFDDKAEIEAGTDPNDPNSFPIEENAASDFIYVVNADNVVIKDYVGTKKDVVIPALIEGKPVVALDKESFYYNQLTSVIIPDSVTFIGEAAFRYNDLTTVDIPSGVGFISQLAFNNNKLTSVNLPAGLQTISGGAFSDNQLTSITLPKGIVAVESNAFNSNKLTSIEIPNSVEFIGTSAFRSNQISHVTIPASVKNIQVYAFYKNPLQSVTIPIDTKLSAIGMSAFASDASGTITGPANITYTVGNHTNMTWVNSTAQDTAIPYVMSASLLTTTKQPTFSFMDNMDRITSVKGPLESSYRNLASPSNLFYTSNDAGLTISSAQLAANRNKELIIGVKDSKGNTNEFAYYYDSKYVYMWEKGSNEAYIVDAIDASVFNVTNLVLPSSINDKTIVGWIGSSSVAETTTLRELTIPASYKKMELRLNSTPNLTKVKFDGTSLSLRPLDTAPFLKSNYMVTVEAKTPQMSGYLVNQLNLRNNGGNSAKISAQHNLFTR